MRWALPAHANPAMMLSHASFPRGGDVARLLENVYDEIFRPKGEDDHPGLWERFAKRLGASDAEPAEGLATWRAEEAQLPAAHGAAALAVRKYYGRDDKTIAYFPKHVRADIGHFDSSADLLTRHIGADRDIARRAAAATLWAWSETRNAIVRDLRRRHGF